MYAKKEHAERLLEITKQTFSQKGIYGFINSGYVNDFQEQLNAMSRARQYKEGEKIMPDDLTLLKENVQKILEDMRVGMLKQSENPTEKLSPKERGAYDPLLSMAQVTDHLYAMTMNTLGCPDIPESFGTDITDLISDLSSQAELEMKEKEYKKTDIERHYNEQRRKSADTVRKATMENRKRIIEKTASPLRVAQYASEYQALKKRQEGHGAIWKFFHKKENEARTKLLENMKGLLVKTLGNDIDVDTLTPKEIAAAYNGTRAAKAFSENGIINRTGLPNTYFEHQPTSTERAEQYAENLHNAIAHDEANRLSIQIPKDIFEEYNADNKEAELSKEENQIIRDPIPQTQAQL